MAEKAPALSYRVESTLLTGDEPVKTARLIEQGEVETTSAQLLGHRHEDAARARAEAEEFLLALLDDGPVRAVRIREEAEAAGIAWRTIERAKAKLKIQSRQAEGAAHGGWAWALAEGHDGLTTDRGGLTAGEQNRSDSADGGLTAAGGGLTVRRQTATMEKDVEI